MHKKGWLPARRQYDQAYISKHTAHDKLGLFYGKIKANYLYRGFSLMNCRQPRFLVLSAEYPGFPTTGQTNYFPGRVLIFFAFDILISHAKIYLYEKFICQPGSGKSTRFLIFVFQPVYPVRKSGYRQL